MDKPATSNHQIDVNIMELKRITFKRAEAQAIYDNYLKQIQAATNKLAHQDQQDILMEWNSHIYESLSQLKNEDEVAGVSDVINRLGVPSEVLKPLVAEKKLHQATRTFNPVHIFQAITLNLSYGILYFVFFVLYLFLLAFVGVIVAKLIYPQQVGLFYKQGEFFQYGFVYHAEQFKQYELLGNWFIPVTIVLGIVFYTLITLLLKLKAKFKNAWKPTNT